MIWFLVGNAGRPPLRLRRLGVLRISLSTIVRMMDLFLGFNLLDPALSEEPTINLLNGLEAQEEELSALLPVANTQGYELF
jgi:hypothetical protein